MIRSVVLIGSGNLAEALAASLARKGLLRQLYARNTARAEEIAVRAGVAWTDDPHRIERADLYLIAVSDKAVAEVAAALPLPSGAVVAHTAGSVPLDALPAAKYPRRAVFYPFQTFTAGRRIDFGEIPIFYEGSDEEVGRTVAELAGRLSRKVYAADSEQRRRVHLAGVFANNFANALFGIGAHILREAGLPEELLRPLLLETAAKAASAADPAEVQTGPAVRGDAEVQRAHLALLDGRVRLQNIYKTLSEEIWQISRKRS